MFDKAQDTLIAGGKKVFDAFIKPFQSLHTNENLREENIRSFLEYRSISEILNYAYAVEDEEGSTVYHLKDGSVGIVLRVQLPTFPSESVERQIGSFLKTVNEDIDVITFNTFASQNLEHELKAFLESHPCDVNIKQRNFLKKLLIRRYEYLKRATRESLFDKIEFRLRNYVSTISIIFNPSVSEEDAFMRIESIKGSLSSFHPRSLPAEEFVSLIREFFHHDKDASFWNNSSDNVVELARQVTRGGLKVDVANEEHKHGFVINDSTYVSVLATKKFPTTIDFEDTDSLFMDRFGHNSQPHIRGPFFTSLVLDYRDIDAIKKKTMADAQANFNETVKISAKDLKKHPDLKKRRMEAEQVIETLNSGRERPVPGQWTLVMWDDNKKRLEQSISSIRNSFQHKGWELLPEVFGHVALFNALFSLPLQLNIVVDKFLQRKDVLFEISNHAPIVPLLGESFGMTANPHIPWFSRTGQLQWFDPFDSDTNYNIACSGDSGSGKSYTVNDIATLSLAQGYTVRIIDSLASYKKISSALGGQYEEFTGAHFCMNFFTHIMEKTDEESGEVLFYVREDGERFPYISDEDYSVIVPIVGLMMGLELSSTKGVSASAKDGMLEAYLSSMIEDAIRSSYEARGKEAGMKDVYEYIKQRYEEQKANGNEEISADLQRAVGSLSRFGSESGPFFSYFNGANNIDIVGDFSVFELQALENKGILYPLTLMSVANRIATEFFNMDNRTKRKMLAIDEYWKYLEMPVVLNFSVELARKIRKAGGLFMPITQGIGDYFVNDKIRAVFANCAWQFVLKNKPVSVDNAIASKQLSVSAGVANMLKDINPKSGMYGEFCIMEGKSLQFSRLRTDGVSHYLFSSNAGDEEKIQRTMKEYSIGYQDAILFLGIRRDEPDWSEERILVEIGVVNEEEMRNREALLKERDEDIQAALSRVIELSNYSIETRTVYNRENESAFKILDFGIRSPRHEVYWFTDYAEKMIEMEIDSDMAIQMFEKALLPDYAQDAIAIVVPLGTLLSNGFYQYAKDMFEPGKYERITLVIDVSLANRFEPEDVRSSIENWRSLGLGIGLKRYSYLVDNALAVDIKPHYTVIDCARFESRPDQLENSIRFAGVFSDEVVLVNSENFSFFSAETLGIRYKDTMFEIESSEDDTEAIVEKVNV